MSRAAWAVVQSAENECKTPGRSHPARERISRAGPQERRDRDVGAVELGYDLQHAAVLAQDGQVGWARTRGAGEEARVSGCAMSWDPRRGGLFVFEGGELFTDAVALHIGM